MGVGNLGDDATLMAVIQKIETRWPDAEISCFNTSAEEVLSRQGAHAYDRWKVGDKPEDTHTASLKDKIKIAVSKYRFLFGLLSSIYAVAIVIPKVCFQELRFFVR